MQDHIIFLLYILLFIHSTIGYGFLFSRMVNRELLQSNLGYIGLIGFFFICLISIFSSFFIPHNFLHNSIFHVIGLVSFIFFFNKLKQFTEIKFLWLIFTILLLGLYVFKNHDDFPYYHLTYALNLSENGFIIGTGQFSHGFRTFSSLFYFHSILYMPFIDFYLFHSGPFIIILFFNFIIISKLFNNLKTGKINFIYFFSLLSVIFINIAFYRISEHGTDRSAQILLILIFIIFFEILYVEKNKNIILPKIYLLVIIVFLASSMKAIYYLYLTLLPIIFYRKKLFKEIFIKKNFIIILFVSTSFFLNLSVSYFNTGCLLYPAHKTCVIEQEWSIEKSEVERMSIHYEWWAKAGGGPNYISEIEPEIYVKNFNWLNNWIERHFFNKVTDTLLGIIFISLFVLTLFIFFSTSKKKTNIKVDFLAYIVPIIFLIEWFLNHPSMRYGGYVLFAIPIFLITALKLQILNLKKKIINILSIFLILLSFTLYNTRNIVRLTKEINFYKYDLLKSPYFFVDNVDTSLVFRENDFKIYSPKNNQMCWASKTPCSYSKNLKVKKFLWMDMVY